MINVSELYKQKKSRGLDLSEVRRAGQKLGKSPLRTTHLVVNDFSTVKQRVNQIKKNSEEINKIIRNKKFYLKHQPMAADDNHYGQEESEDNYMFFSRSYVPKKLPSLANEKGNNLKMNKDIFELRNKTTTDFKQLLQSKPEPYTKSQKQSPERINKLQPQSKSVLGGAGVPNVLGMLDLHTLAKKRFEHDS
jgi:hypothetical protein